MIGNQTSPPTVYPYKTYDQIENYATQLPHYINNIRGFALQTYPAPGLSGSDFLCRAGEVGWDRGWSETPEPALPYLLRGKLLADLDFTLPRTIAGAAGTVPLPLREWEREVLTGTPWLWVWSIATTGGGGIRASLPWVLRDFSSSSSFCMSSGEICRVALGSPGQGRTGMAGMIAKEEFSSSSPGGSKRGDRLVLILSGYKNSSWVPVRRRACKNMEREKSTMWCDYIKGKEDLFGNWSTNRDLLPLLTETNLTSYLVFGFGGRLRLPFFAGIFHRVPTGASMWKPKRKWSIIQEVPKRTHSCTCELILYLDYHYHYYCYYYYYHHHHHHHHHHNYLNTLTWKLFQIRLSANSSSTKN